MNAKVGSNNGGLEQVTGAHGVGNVNENGEMFINLVIVCTVFLHKTCHKIMSISRPHHGKSDRPYSSK
jgi:hypothetical protein